MEFAQVLLVLWRRRRLVAVGGLLALVVALSTGYRIGIFPPRLSAKSLAVGSASTKLLVDTPRSALTDLSKDVTVLSTRAAVLAPFMTTEPVRQAIARTVGLPQSEIYTEAPLDQQALSYTGGPSQAQRNQQVIGQGPAYRLTFQADLNQPTISVTGQAPTVEGAVRLTNGAATAINRYFSNVENLQNVPLKTRTLLRQLGPAAGGMIGGSVNKQLVAITFLGVLLGWMILVVIATGVVDNLHQLRVSGASGPEQRAETS